MMGNIILHRIKITGRGPSIRSHAPIKWREWDTKCFKPPAWPYTQNKTVYKLNKVMNMKVISAISSAANAPMNFFMETSI